jgi:hypothetical protein
MDRKWRPVKTTVLTKTVEVKDGRRRETILKAVETKDGKTEDVTERYLAEAAARRERQRQRERDGAQRPERPREGGGDGRRGNRMNIQDLLPFAPERRVEFVFAARETADSAGRQLVVLDVKARVKDTRNWEGTYTIDPATSDIREVRLVPSKNPTFVKDLAVEAEVEVLPSGAFILKRTRLKVNAGFLVKHVRTDTEEIYSDIRALAD